MASHTPGPWAVCTVPPEDNPYWLPGLSIGAADPKDARKVCTVHDWGLGFNPEFSGRQMTEANACLIAAAPDLLEALKKLLEEAENFSVSGVYFSEPCMGHVGPDLARAAIAKAEAPARKVGE